MIVGVQGLPWSGYRRSGTNKKLMLNNGSSDRCASDERKSERQVGVPLARECIKHIDLSLKPAHVRLVINSLTDQVILPVVSDLLIEGVETQLNSCD